MSTLMFRNVDAKPSDPLGTWPHEVFQAAIEHGLVRDWRRIAHHIDAHPIGEAAATLAEVLEYDDDSVGAFLLRDRLEKARAAAVHDTVRRDAQELTRLVASAGISQRELARRIGASESRLSTWLSGKQAPSAQTLAKIKLALADVEEGRNAR